MVHILASSGRALLAIVLGFAGWAELRDWGGFRAVLRFLLPRMNCWRCSFTHVVTLLLVAGPASVSATQEGAGETAIEPCRESCGLTLVPEREYGDDSGPGMIEAAGARAWLDESGRLYLLGAVTHVQVYGPDGAFLRRISRRGSGPGELENGHSLVVTGDGVFSILDRSQGKILTFDWNGELLHEIRPHGWFPFGSGTVHVGGPLAVHHADIQTPDRVGYPLHLVNLETGEAVGSFGSLTGEYDLFFRTQPCDRSRTGSFGVDGGEVRIQDRTVGAQPNPSLATAKGVLVPGGASARAESWVGGKAGPRDRGHRGR